MKFFLDLFKLPENEEILDKLKNFLSTQNLPYVEISKVNNFLVLAYPFTRLINNYLQLTIKVGYFFPLDIFIKNYGKLYTYIFLKHFPVKLVKKGNFKGVNFLSFRDNNVIFLENEEKKELSISHFFISFPFYFFKVFSKFKGPPYKIFTGVKKEITYSFFKKFQNFLKKKIKIDRVFTENIILPPEMNWEKLYNLILFKKPLVYPQKAHVIFIYDTKNNFESGKNFLNFILENKKIPLKISKVRITQKVLENERNIIKLLKSLSNLFNLNKTCTFIICLENLDLAKFVRNVIFDAVVLDTSYLSSSDFKYKVYKALCILNLMGFQILSLPILKNFSRLVNVIDYPKNYLINIFEQGILKETYFTNKLDKTYLQIYKDSVFILPFEPSEEIPFIRYYPTNLPGYFPTSIERGYLVFEDFLFKYYFSFWKENPLSFAYGDINILPSALESLISPNSILPNRFKAYKN